MSMNNNEIRWCRTRPDAVIPTKAHDSDSGWDLTLLEPLKTLAGITVLYSTGISVEVPVGYYFDLVPRSSLSKTGHIQANSVGIIDFSYRGEILVPVIRLTEGEPGPLEMPQKLFQLILRKRADIGMVSVVVDSLDDTPRGAGGFGSSDKK